MAIKGARAEDGRVTPHLMVRGGKRAVAFYTRAFGATVLYESPMPYGDGIHAHLQVGKTMIMITDEYPPSPDGMTLGVAAPESLGATTTILEYYVDDADQAVQRAIDAGAKPILPLNDSFYGDRFGWVLDPFGHIWALGTVKEELTPEQVINGWSHRTVDDRRALARETERRRSSQRPQRGREREAFS